MPVYSLDVIPISALNFSGNSPSSHSDGNGAGWTDQNYTFTYNAGAISPISVTDADWAFQDDPQNPEWGGDTWPAHQQVLTNDTTINGVTRPAGTQLDNEYELNVVDQFGTTYRLVAVAVFASPTEPSWGSYTVVGYTFDGDWPPEGAILTSQSGTVADGQEINPVCFCKGTLIATSTGEVPIEAVQVGDLVMTANGSAVAVRWHGCRKVSALSLLLRSKLRPIRIRKGALGRGLPQRDLMVSPQHRLLAKSVVVSRMVDGTDEVLVAAKHLVALPGIDVVSDFQSVEYYHLMCDNHEILFAEGALTESLYPGPQALQSISPEQYEEICTLFPEIRRGTHQVSPARPLLPGRRARKLALRLANNSIPVCC